MTTMTDDTTHGAPQIAAAARPVAQAHGKQALGQQATGQQAHGQQHPIKLYLLVWTLLFVLSACSYLVDYFDFHGLLRWTLIVVFMLLKAGLIVAVFMHMAWERLALVVAILTPPLAVLVLMAMMAWEGDYTNYLRVIFFGA